MADKLVLLETHQTETFVPWHKENPLFARNVQEAMEWRRMHWDANNFGVILDITLVQSRPSEVVEALREEGFDPENLVALLSTRGVSAYYVEDEGARTVRLVDGYTVNGQWQSSVYKDVQWK